MIMQKGLPLPILQLYGPMLRDTPSKAKLDTNLSLAGIVLHQNCNRIVQSFSFFISIFLHHEKVFSALHQNHLERWKAHGLLPGSSAQLSRPVWK